MNQESLMMDEGDGFMIAEQRKIRKRVRDNLSSSMSPTRLKTDA